MADWLTGGISTQLIELAGLSMDALTKAISITLLPGSQAQIPNPFAGQNLPGIPNGTNLTVKATDLSKILRQFGHPYTDDRGRIIPSPPLPPGDYTDW